MNDDRVQALLDLIGEILTQAATIDLEAPPEQCPSVCLDVAAWQRAQDFDDQEAHDACS